jgi:hypothetical protein
MPFYRVEFRGSSWYQTTVEADNKESAEDLAADNIESICAICSGWGREYSREEDDCWEVQEITEVKEMEDVD